MDCRNKEERMVFPMSTIKHPFVRLCSVFLAAVLCAALMAPCIRPASADYLSGDWEKVSLSDGDQSLTVYAFRFDETVRNCTSFDLEIDVSMKNNTHCQNWQIWLGYRGDYTKVSTLNLPGGDGYASKTVRLSGSQTFDAIAVTPTASGSYSWSLWLGVSNVSTTSTGSGGATSPTTGTGSSDFLSGDWEKVHIGNSNVYAYVFDNTVRRCTQLTIDIDVSMKYNASCKKWQVWYRSGSGFSKLGTISLPGGNGEATETFYPDSPITFDAIAVTPIQSGSFSWNMGLLVYDVKCK